MSEDFSPVSITRLFKWIEREEKEQGSVFGVPRQLWFTPEKNDPFRMKRFGTVLDTPLGVAAGPHTQMAQNIVTAWLCGSRYIELKTVQTLDRLEVSKPCIDMQDEGYNCEWSQELRLGDSLSEYVNAWILIHVLNDKFGFGRDPGCVFNMSVGYDLKGILRENVQNFLRSMRESSLVKERIDDLRPLYPGIDKIDIPTGISDNVTLSTMHGCPPDEVEKIGLYLVKDLKLNTVIKLNPTLLGPAELRSILNDRLGFTTNVPNEAFDHDLKYDDACDIIRNLAGAARESGVAFGLKLTNTLESVNHKEVFSGEKMMYMSGRALHPVSVNLACRLQKEFDGKLDISFSAGADAFNIADLLACGLRPVTVCSDLLKPGGYGRMAQYIENIESAMRARGARSIDEYIDGRSGGKGALAFLEEYSGRVPEDDLYKAAFKKSDSIKTRRRLEFFDCTAAPCVDTCPAEQEIPLYMRYCEQADYERAFQVILRTNPFPNVCGQVCDHSCQMKCTRINYDESLLIREIKRFISEKAKEPSLKPKASVGKSAAIIGGGPSGLSCAFYLALDGFDVTVFEAGDRLGGWLRNAIPGFRLSRSALDRDIDRILGLGVKVRTSERIDRRRFEELRDGFDFVYAAIGAGRARKLMIDNEDAEGVVDCLEFLSLVSEGRPPELGRRVLVIGGGNSAMDAARTAWRHVGADGEVSVLYRRSKEQMPADPEEIDALVHEGIKIEELVSPFEIKTEKGRVSALRCRRMRLGEKDSSGRPRPVPVKGSGFDIPVDTIIPALGQSVVVDFFDDAPIKVLDSSGRTGIENVYAGGDAVRGPATIIKAVADGRASALAISRKAATAARMQADVVAAGHSADRSNPGADPEAAGYSAREAAAGRGLSVADIQKRRAWRSRSAGVPETAPEHRRSMEPVTGTLDEEAARAEAGRCLHCDVFCDVCVTVCPNRANVSYRVKPGDYPVFTARGDANGNTGLFRSGTFSLLQERQVLNIGDFCNECGNCTTFCPTSGSPYKDKPKFYLSRESFEAEDDAFHISEGKLSIRRNGRSLVVFRRDNRLCFEGDGVSAIFHPDSFAVTGVEFTGREAGEYVLREALEAVVLFVALERQAFVG